MGHFRDWFPLLLWSKLCPSEASSFSTILWFNEECRASRSSTVLGEITLSIVNWHCMVGESRWVWVPFWNRSELVENPSPPVELICNFWKLFFFAFFFHGTMSKWNAALLLFREPFFLETYPCSINPETLWVPGIRFHSNTFCMVLAKFHTSKFRCWGFDWHGPCCGVA